MRKILFEKNTISSFIGNKDWKKVKVENRKVNNLFPIISTKNISELASEIKSVFFKATQREIKILRMKLG